MTKNRASTASVTELLDAYRDAAARHGEATEKGDYKVANKMADIVATVYAELRRRGAREELLPLLADEAPGVRLWVGSHALEFAPQEGKRVLTSLTEVGRLLGMSAETTLNEWRAGRLRFP
jgi:hypothetical protein